LDKKYYYGVKILYLIKKIQLKQTSLCRNFNELIELKNTMPIDYKLFFQILLRETIIVALLVVIFNLIIPGKTDYFYWTFFVLTLSCIIYFKQIESGYEIGILEGDDNYLQTNFEEIIQSSKTKTDILKSINMSSEYLGKVKYEGEIIRKQNWRKIFNLSKSEIVLQKGSKGKTYYRLITKPVFPFVKFDHYTNFKCFSALKEIVSDT